MFLGGEVRPEVGVLADEGGAAVVGRDAGDVAVCGFAFGVRCGVFDGAGGGGFESGEEPGEGGFAGARGAEERGDAGGVECERDGAEGVGRFAVAAGEIGDADVGHGGL